MSSKPEFKEGFRVGMTPTELSIELATTMKVFRPAVAEIARNSLRWEFCARNGFPYGNELANPDHRWCVHVRPDWNEVSTSTHFGSTAAEAVDKAIVQEEKDREGS
jgi:hypothetical protein